MTLRQIGISHCVNKEARKFRFKAFLQWVSVHVKGHQTLTSIAATPRKFYAALTELGRKELGNSYPVK